MSTKTDRLADAKIVLLCAIATTFAFFFDLSLPLGVAGGVPYVAVVLLSLWARRCYVTIPVAATCSALTIIGYFLSPSGGEPWKVQMNRALTLFAIWVTATICLFLKRQALKQVDNFSKLLLYRENHLQAILESAADPILTISPEGIIVSFNPAAEKLFGYTEAELVGKNVRILLPPKYRDGHDAKIASYLNARESNTVSAQLEVVGQRKDGTTVPITLTVSAVTAKTTDQGGKDQPVLFFTGIIHDLTKQKRVEECLIEAKEAAEDANQTKNDFLANMSHEMRTPLAAVLGFTNLLLQDIDGGDEAERRDFLETIDSSGKHLLNLIDDILDLSKIEAGELSIQCVTCSPRQILEEAIIILRARAEEKNLTLSLEGAVEIPELIETDPSRFRQLLLNLVGNAIKFSQCGEVRIATKIIDTQRGRQLEVQVIDTGIGIEEDKMEVIFKPFVQADNSATRKYGGTGLGLSICRYIVERLGGSLQVESQVGIGSTFTATIDARQPKNLDENNDRNAVVKSPGNLKNGPLQSAKILAVEDGFANQKLIAMILRRAGADVMVANNGKEGLELALQQPFDLILMDIQMPVLDGYEATRELRSRGFKKPIVALTAHAMTGDCQKCLDAGCDEYQAKPIEGEKLIATVKKHLIETGVLPGNMSESASRQTTETNVDGLVTARRR